MSDIDELSKTLGQMQCGIAQLVKNTDATNEKLDRTHDGFIEVKLSAKSAHKRLDTLAPQIKDLTDLKNKALGVVAVIGAISGATVVALIKAIKLLPW